MIFKLTVNQNSIKKTFSVDYSLTLRESLIRENLIFDAPCGGKGLCGKCKALVVSSSKTIENQGKYILLCKTYPTCDMEIEIGEQDEEISFFSKPNSDISNIICDIGTTTVVLSFFDESGLLCAKSTFLNPQKTFGADVISRIKSCQEYGVSKVREPLIIKIENLISKYKSITRTKTIDRVIIVSNTVMSHIFLGVSPESMAKSPYEPLFLDAKNIAGKEVGLSVNSISLSPSVSAFLGSDFLVGLSYANSFSHKKPYLYLDLGTNGEIALFDGNKIYATSCAVGPAFEGGNIECGIGGVSGAIVAVEDNDGQLDFKTIDEKSAIGICGAGLISLMSYLKDSFVISSDGTFLNNLQKFFLTDKVYLTQKDIRQFQLAKSAIKTGVDVLINKANIKIESIENVYFAGGLGEHVDIYALFNLGILPKDLQQKCKKVGNTALKGAEKLLLGELNNDYFEKIKRNIVSINLANEKDFELKFTSNVNF